MESQEILEKEIGCKETTALKPAKVKIVNLEIQEVGEKGNKKLICLVKHPGKEEPIQISSVKFESKGKLDVVGLWINLDEDNKIRKGSALAHLLSYCICQTPKGLIGKEIETSIDDKGYLCFKAY